MSFTRIQFINASVGELDTLNVAYKVVHGDEKLIVDHVIGITQQTKFEKNKTTAKMVIEVESLDGIEGAMDKLADHLARMTSALKERGNNPSANIPTFTIMKGLV